jgi:hypothetical protein
VFKTLLMEVYALPEALVDDLLLKNRRHPSTDPTYRPLPLDRPAFATAFRPSPNLICPSVLYPPSSPLAALNTPLYVATDSTNPRSDVVIEMFRNTFPCLFFLSDFRSKNAHNSVEIDELKWFAELVDEEGEILGSFLEPFVDAEVIAKGKKVVGSESILSTSKLNGILMRLLRSAWFDFLAVRTEYSMASLQRCVVTDGRGTDIRESSIALYHIIVILTRDVNAISFTFIYNSNSSLKAVGPLPPVRSLLLRPSPLPHLAISVSKLSLYPVQRRLLLRR